jgi:hypothetical protein
MGFENLDPSRPFDSQRIIELGDSILEIPVGTNAKPEIVERAASALGQYAAVRTAEQFDSLPADAKQWLLAAI